MICDVCFYFHKMTCTKNLHFRNFNTSSLLLIVYILLITSSTQGKRIWTRAENTEKCDDPVAVSNEHKENSEIASLIAQKAAQEAKEAYEAQNQAGAEAALEVKEELAQRAEDAARAAQAALAGKQAVVDELERQIKESEIVIKEQQEAQQKLTEADKQAKDSAKQMDMLTKTLQQATQMAQGASSCSKAAAKQIEVELNAKCNLIDQAQKQIAKLIEDLKTARVDLDKTMLAAKKAVGAAKTAEDNANRQKRAISKRYLRAYDYR